MTIFIFSNDVKQFHLVLRKQLTRFFVAIQQLYLLFCLRKEAGRWLGFSGEEEIYSLKSDR